MPVPPFAGQPFSFETSFQRHGFLETTPRDDHRDHPVSHRPPMPISTHAAFLWACATQSFAYETATRIRAKQPKTDSDTARNCAALICDMERPFDRGTFWQPEKVGGINIS